MTVEETKEFVTIFRNTFQRVATLPIPTIAAIEGVAVGGGLELALATDIRIAATTTIFGLPETSLGIIPGAGGTQRLTRLIGIARTKELIFTASRINGKIAEQYGIVQQVVEPGQVFDAALDMAWKIAENGPIAIRLAKYAIDAGLEKYTLEDALEIERLSYNPTVTTKDRLEGLQAFKEGRKPNYKGE
jgi:enoyl-CoA hydratase/carnithine racemase